MNIGLVNGFSSITNGNGALTASKMSGEKAKFSELLETLSSSQVSEEGRLNGDYKSGFSGTYKGNNNKQASVQGAAANQANDHVKSKTIDKTSKLYEKSMELESYFVKQMLSEMRKTVNKSALGGSDFAGQMYEDMLFDEYATSMTKNAGFGLADQIYLSLV
ncbi:MAG: rod-binding protein [Treponema sp.]|nr:rod-binding protein [Treponema sp.]